MNAAQLVSPMASRSGGQWQRRARPLLGTIVEIGVLAEWTSARLEPAVEAAFAAIAEVQRCLSRFDAESDIGRFNELQAGSRMPVRRITREVLEAACQLRDESEGLFDITQGSGPLEWRCVDGVVHKSSLDVRLDVGGIGKGYAVDAAVDALLAQGCGAGWVNAGGDLRAFGDVDVPVWLRDETRGGGTPFAMLADGAFATSRYAADSRSRLASRRRAAPPGRRADTRAQGNIAAHADADADAAAPPHDGLAAAHRRDTSAAADAGHSRTAVQAHVSVAAPLCMWADALTKVVALSGDARHPLLARYGATAWLHAPT